MGSHYIKSVVAVRDAIDRLEWDTRISAPFGSAPSFVVHWEGNVVFYKEPIASNQGMGPSFPRRALAARWTNRENAARVLRPDESTFTFVTELPGDALDRIESFRDGGRLFARLEGTRFVVNRDPGFAVPNQPKLPWLDDVADIMGRGNRPWTDNVWSEPFELREIWCTQVLATLRPPGRFVLDLQLPSASADGDTAKRALDHIANAKKTFIEGGRDGEVGRICYRALDELRKLADGVEARYGKFGRDRIIAQIKETKSLCDPERHGDAPHHDDLEFDRTLAQHVLAVTSSIAGLLMH
jgi:hypothetical protein